MRVIKETSWVMLIVSIIFAVFATVTLAINKYEQYEQSSEPPIPIIPEPYKDVNLLSVTFVDNKRLQLEFSFIKLECTFVRIEVFADYTGRPQPLSWQALDATDKNNYDRSAGLQYLILEIEADSRAVLEVRTRHECEAVNSNDFPVGKIFNNDKVFFQIDLNNYKLSEGY